MNKKMRSIWHENVSLPNFSGLNGDVKTEVLIIGGGIVGLLTALLLHQKGVPYILAEKNRICSGTTQNTTAKITFQHGLIYDKLIKSFGVDGARMYLEANRTAFEKLTSMCGKTECDFEFKDNYVYSTDSPAKLEKELTALRKIGYDADFVSDLSLPLDTVGAVRFKNQAQFNPLKFFAEISKNLNIFENTFVREMQGNTAVTDRGKIYADKVVVATHFPMINKHGAYFIKLYQHRSYVIALENAQDVGGMYVGESKTGFSFRNYGRYLLLGGGSHRTGKNGGNWRQLREFASEKYPEATEKFFWAAQDCMSLDDMPYIGEYSERTHKLYTACGFNKWGMTGAMLSAEILCDLVCGEQNVFADFFSPSRGIFKPQLAVNGFESMLNLLIPSKKRCPHLGCALKWNKAEHSWDCPCHGSRFDKSGRLLENPANGDLDKK